MLNLRKLSQINGISEKKMKTKLTIEWDFSAIEIVSTNEGLSEFTHLVQWHRPIPVGVRHLKQTVESPESWESLESVEVFSDR